MLFPIDDWEQVRKDLRLSQREFELVCHIFHGKKLQVIADDMRLSLGTVKTYSQRVYHKLQIHDQRELIFAVLRSHVRSLES